MLVDGYQLNLISENVYLKFVSRKNILLGDTESKNNALLNHISILGKRYIYVNKCLKRELNVQTDRQKTDTRSPF
jgi:hypothetical protein